MGDSILSVRIDEELKQRFINMAQEAGINNKDFMDQIIGFYELNNVSSSMALYSGDIEELQSITKRMMDIYINMAEKSKVKETESKNKSKSLIKEKDEEINTLKEYIEKNKEKDELIKKLKSQLNASNDRISKIEEDNENLKNLNKLMKEKNNNLSDKIEDVKDKVNNYSILKKDYEILQKELKDEKEKSDRLNTKYELLINEKERACEDFEEKILRIKENNSGATQLLKQKQELEISNAKANLRDEMNQKIDVLKEEHNSKIMKLIQEKEEYINRINDLISKSAKNSTPTSKE